MDISNIQAKLAKTATKLIAGGFKPSGEKTESWLGHVFLFQKNEIAPVDEKGKPMLPLAQLYLPSFPFVHPLLKNIQLLTIFISADFPVDCETIGDNWIIREYENIDTLEARDISYPDSYLNAFPIEAKLIKKDYPLWDGGGVPEELEDAVLKLEKEGVIESYYDITTHVYDHKIGGYPSFCQSGIDFGDNYEFVFQISSDSKINLNVIDSGSFIFSKNRKTSKWKIYYDFY